MGFQVSPGVNVKEIDLTTIVPAVATTQAAFAGPFKWGPCEVRTNVVSEDDLVNTFWKPDNTYANSFFTCANFLGYSNNLQVVRVVDTSTAKNAGDGTVALVKNDEHWYGTVQDAGGDNTFLAKYPGALGNSLSVFVFDDDGSKGATGGIVTGAGGTASVALSAVSVGDLSFSLGNQVASINATTLGASAGDQIQFFGSGQGGRVIVTLENDVTGVSAGIIVTSPFRDSVPVGTSFGIIRQNSKSAFLTSPTTTEDVASAGGTNDAMNILVIDQDGEFSGTKGTILERFENVSKATDAIKYDGTGNFYKDVINQESRYIWADADLAGITTTTKAGTTFTDITGDGNVAGQHNTASTSTTLAGGVDAYPSDGDIYTKGWAEFEDAESVDVSLLLSGEASATIQRLLIDLCDRRKDCIALLSPTSGSTGAAAANLVKNKTASQALENIRNFRNQTLNKSSSYAVLDSGFKYQYDRYNDVYRYVPLNGDIGGLIARSEVEQDAWWSPAGFSRGQIKGVVKLAFNPKKAHRDDLYVDQINPVVAFPGEGVVLYGDKTLQSKPSAFDRINVRRLFIVLEKAIATAAKFSLFEFNDEFTRSQFRNMVVPFLRDVQARRGIYDFKVVCDESNNPGSVIDRNEFVADLYIKPARAINFITLNFIATPTGVDFSEVGG